VSTYDNGAIDTPDWTPEPRDCELEALLLSRVANDTGVRHDLDDVIRSLGFDPDELRAEPCPLPTCDICDTNADQVSGYGTYPLPERFILGEN
jgi:hypothetical protein